MGVGAADDPRCTQVAATPLANRAADRRVRGIRGARAAARLRQHRPRRQAVASGHPESAGVVLGNRHAEIVDALEAETGGTQFIRIGFYGDYAIAAAPSAPGALTIDSYAYRYDRTERQGPELIQPQDPAAELFDTTGLDFSQIPGFIAAAKEQSGITQPDSVIVIVNRSGIADAAGEMPVQAMVLLDSPYEDATVSFDMATGEPTA